MPSGVDPPGSDPPDVLPEELSALNDAREPTGDPVRDTLDFLVRMQSDQARLLVRVIEVVQMFVLERTAGQTIDKSDLDAMWARVAALFNEHAAAVHRELHGDGKSGKN